jgi:hypothetical protein
VLDLDTFDRSDELGHAHILVPRTQLGKTELPSYGSVPSPTRR